MFLLVWQSQRPVPGVGHGPSSGPLAVPSIWRPPPPGFTPACEKDMVETVREVLRIAAAPAGSGAAEAAEAPLTYDPSHGRAFRNVSVQNSRLTAGLRYRWQPFECLCARGHVAHHVCVSTVEACPPQAPVELRGVPRNVRAPGPAPGPEPSSDGICHSLFRPCQRRRPLSGPANRDCGWGVHSPQFGRVGGVDNGAKGSRGQCI